MVIELSEVIALKKEILEKYDVQLHFHDGCGGQYFTLDRTMPELEEHISSLFAQKGYRISFSENGKRFSIRENT